MEYPKIIIYYETEIDGKTHNKGVSLNLENININMIEKCLVGEVGKPFKYLLIDVIRTQAKIKKEKQGNS